MIALPVDASGSCPVPPPATAQWRSSAFARLAGLALALVLFMPGMPARADEGIRLERAELVTRRDVDPGVFVEAQFDFRLPAALADAVNRGVPLYFTAEFELTRSRWYWFDEKIVDASLQWRLSYSPLTGQYRINRGGLGQPFDTLDLALAAIRRIVGWKVLDAGVLSPGDRFHARLRLRLDTSMLPKPFQVTALTDRDWNLASDWHALAVGDDSLARH